MSLSSLAEFELRSLAPPGTVRRAALVGVLVVILLGLLFYMAMLGVVGQPPSSGTRLFTDLMWVLGILLIAFLGYEPIVRRISDPITALWMPLYASGLGILLALLVILLTGGPTQLNPLTGLPVTGRGAIQVTLLTLIEACVALVLLMALYTLVQFRRTTAGRRNWLALVWLIVLASIVLAGYSPLEHPARFIPHTILFAFSILFMVVNAFRLDWIIYLPFRRKMLALVLAISTILLLSIVLGIRSEDSVLLSGMQIGLTPQGDSIGVNLTTTSADTLPEYLTWISATSVPVSRFIVIVVAFGILYASTSVMALLFQLPTAGALQQKTGEMEALQALARLSGEVFDRDQLVDTIAGAPVEAGLAQSAWLALVDTRHGSLTSELVSSNGLTPIQIEAMVDFKRLSEDAASGPAILLDNATVDHRVHARPGDGIGSLLAIPLRSRNERLGTLFATKSISQGFQKDDVSALETFASQAALALSNARLFHEQLEAERITRELIIAREVQQRLLPKTLPCTEHFSCAALSIPAQEVAGDFYDVLQLDEHRLGLIVADVAGKGTSAAFHMAELKGAFQALARLAEDPSELLRKLNAALFRSLHRKAFISAIYAEINESTSTVTIVRAGHCPALLVRPGEGITFIRPNGLGIGMDKGPLFRKALVEETIPLKPGDSLLLYTDGLIEARDSSGEEYGYNRLADAALRLQHTSPENMQYELLEDLRRFVQHSDAAEDAWEDDLTLIVVKWQAEASTSPAAIHHPTAESS